MKIDRKKIYDKCNGRCAYCGEKLPEKGWQVDHVWCREYHDLHTTTHGWEMPQQIKNDVNHFSNLMPSCRRCNNHKSTYPLENWRKELERQVEIALKGSTAFNRAVRFGQVKLTPQPIVFYFEKIGIKLEEQE